MHIPTLELAFSIRIEFDPGPRLRFQPSETTFTRGFVAVKGGTVSGPRLNGRVLPRSGGDWPRIWQSGLVEFEAHYQLEADDGTPIYVHNRGLAWSSYCRITPRFEAPEGPYAWLTRTVFVGVAERQGDSTAFDYYAVT